MSNPLANAVALAVNRLRQDAKGVIALTAWIGDGAMPVSHEQAEARAAVCAQCPQNVRRRKVENSIAEAIRTQEEARSKVNLRTSNDFNLNTCETCGCYLKLKVWVPLEHQTDADFPPKCWVRKEREASKVKPHTNEAVEKKMVSIARAGAFGDVITASIVATKLKELGYAISFSACTAAATCLKHHPHIDSILEEDTRCEVDLNGSYEKSPHRNTKDRSTIMLEVAATQLEARGLKVPDFFNRVPTLGVSKDETELARSFLDNYPRPWTVMVPKSAAWPNRSVSDKCLGDAAELIPGTVFWAFPSPNPGSTVKLQMKTFRCLMAAIKECDLVITPDTGPIHIAAAFNKKIVYLKTCNPSELILTDLTDYKTVSSQLECIGCNTMVCPINPELPPCREIPHNLIAHAAIKKLESDSSGKVSAIIPVYRYSDRLLRCIDAIRCQVDEIVVALDGTCAVPNLGEKVVVIKNINGRRNGYGKTCNRGVRHSSGQFLLMLNDDCYMDPESVDKMKICMSANVSVVGAQLWYPNGTIQHGGTFRKHGDIGWGHLDHRKTTPSVTKARTMEFVTFASALVRRSTFFNVRGFDERYDCYSEDADFCMKVIYSTNEIIMYQPLARGIHDESQSTSHMKQELLMSASNVFRSKWEWYFRHNTPPK